MNLGQLAIILERKYLKVASEADHFETNIRNNLDSLWLIPNKTFNILRACADSNASKPKNDQEKLAVEGFQFCKTVVSIIDYLKSHRSDLPLEEIKKLLDQLLNYIKNNMSGELQFPQVSELIYQIMPYGKKHDRKIRDQEYAKARKGLSRIVSLTISILNDFAKLAGKKEQGGRFEPIGAKLSESEIMNFIRQYGDSYNIPDLETWNIVIGADPSIEILLTRVIHALLRGQSPIEGAQARKMIVNILSRHGELNQPTNNLALEQEDTPPMPIVLDEKMASKYF